MTGRDNRPDLAWPHHRDGPRLCRNTRPLVAGLLLGVLLSAVALVAG